MTYDYYAKGRSDFIAGRKDDKLYGGCDLHNSDYRRGWQQARRQAADADRLAGFEHAGQTPVAVSLPVSAPTPSDASPWASEAPPRPADSSPAPAARPATSVFAASNEVEKTNVGEDSPKPAKRPERPAKAKPVDPTPQLDLFA